MMKKDAGKKSFGKRKFTPKTLQSRKEYVKNCIFCKQEKEPDYKDFVYLKSFVSERARILGRVYTGVCSKHQIRLSSEIKKARFLGLLPYAPTSR